MTSVDAVEVGLLLALATSGVIAIVNLVSYRLELRELRHIAKERLGQPPASHDHLVRLLHLLHERVSYDGLDKAMRRPLLRETALQTLRSGKGFCGENARLAIRLMACLGVPAARIYVSGERWPHVLTECLVNGRWWLFDGHNDPETAMTPADVCAIESPHIQLLRNNHPNPYQSFQRIRLFHGRPWLDQFERVRLPDLVIQVFESPNLIKAGLGICGLIGLLWLRSCV